MASVAVVRGKDENDIDGGVVVDPVDESQR